MDTIEKFKENLKTAPGRLIECRELSNKIKNLAGRIKAASEQIKKLVKDRTNAQEELKKYLTNLEDFKDEELPDVGDFSSKIMDKEQEVHELDRERISAEKTLFLINRLVEIYEEGRVSVKYYMKPKNEKINGVIKVKGLENGTRS